MNETRRWYAIVPVEIPYKGETLTVLLAVTSDEVKRTEKLVKFMHVFASSHREALDYFERFTRTLRETPDEVRVDVVAGQDTT